MDPQADSIIIRSLRRRLWRALREEDLEAATKIYTASRRDFEQWVAQEQAEAEAKQRAEEEARAREKKEKREARPAAFKKFGSMVRSTRKSFDAELKKTTSKHRTRRSLDLAPIINNGGNEVGGRSQSFRLNRDSRLSDSHKSSSLHDVTAELPMLRAASSGYGGLGLLQFELNPSEPFTLDDKKDPNDSYFEDPTPTEEEKPPRKIKFRRSSLQPRLAGFFGRFGDKEKIIALASPDEESTGDEINMVDTTMTTPLHEVARLGGGSLLRLMLASGGDPNVKNGMMRTALHMTAGGLTQEEEHLTRAAQAERDAQLETIPERRYEWLGPGVAIRKNHVDPEEDSEDDDNSSEQHRGARKAARVMGRFFKMGKASDSDKDQDAEEESQERELIAFDTQRFVRLISDRIDAVLAILTWCHEDDGSARSGEGASINSVDARGRTALHYSSELGRNEVCMAVLSSFGAILTIVDESGFTPCELACRQYHFKLAYQLEARALLHSDPYGMDDELMATVLNDSRFARDDSTGNGDAEGTDFLTVSRVRHRAIRKRVFPPFSWFETWTMEEVRAERNDRINDALDQMRAILTERRMDKEMNELMFSHGGFNDLDEETVEMDFGNTTSSFPIGGTGGAYLESALIEDFVIDNNEVTDPGTDTECGHAHGIVPANGEPPKTCLKRESERDEDWVSFHQTGGGRKANEIVFDTPTNRESTGHTDPMITENANLAAAGDENKCMNYEEEKKLTQVEPENRTLANGDVGGEDSTKQEDGIKEPGEKRRISKQTETEKANLKAADVFGGSSEATGDEKVENGSLKPKGGEGGSSEVEIWSAVVPEGIEPDERFTICLDEQEIHVRCPPNLQPGQTFQFTIPEQGSESIGGGDETRIQVLDEAAPLQASVHTTTSAPEFAPKDEDRVKRIHESHAERLLASHGWSVEEAVAAFRSDPETALDDAGVALSLENEDGGAEFWRVPADVSENVTCLICCEEFNSSDPEWINMKGCDHGFCAECLAGYIADTAQARSSGLCVPCPHHDCSALLTQSELKQLAPSADVFDSMAQAADENFVAAADRVRFCPHPGCAGVVRYLVPEFVKNAKRDPSLVGLTGAVCRAVTVDKEYHHGSYTYEGIQDSRYDSMTPVPPAAAHRFCFQCGEAMHWPVTCERLAFWKAKVEEEVGPEDGELTGQKKIDDVAQRLWMKANTRPCPQCKAPIEKNDGCNHMTCTNRHCRHEFCWICRKDWKLHNTETGGFFRCNRWQAEADHEYYDDPPLPQHENADTPSNETNDAAQNAVTDQSYGSAIHSARAAWKKSKVMARFLHHYRRWTAHSESTRLESQIAETVAVRMTPVVEAAIDFSGDPGFDFGGKGLSFVYAAFTELKECRSVLQHSYAFAFFRYPTFYYLRQHRIMRQKEKEKGAFEHIQSELEMLTEQLSDIVARQHLRATQVQIMFLTKGAAEKRREFTSFMIAIMDEERKEEKRKEEEENRAESPQSLTSSSSPTLSTEMGVPPAHAQLLRPPGVTQVEAPNYFPAPARDSLMPTPVHVRVDPTEGSLLQRAEEEAVRQAMEASMQAFIDRSVPTHDLIDTSGVDANQWADWSCSVCTYMNAGGSSCAMCGNLRS